jgi:hypothetical protein
MNHIPKTGAYTHQEWGIYWDLQLLTHVDPTNTHCCTLIEEQKHSDAELTNRLASGADSGWDLPLVVECHRCVSCKFGSGWQ